MIKIGLWRCAWLNSARSSSQVKEEIPKSEWERCIPHGKGGIKVSLNTFPKRKEKKSPC